MANMSFQGRVGEPQDIARVVLFLVSDEAGWMTGQNISVSGGAA
jgi:3-oxoacyl-[acyl-carrier protein] reductase